MPLGAVKVTIQKFYRISGESTQEKGVTPDVVLPSRLDGLESGEKYLDYALAWDHIKSADYQRWGKSLKNVDKLRRLSLARISQDKDFDDIVTEAQEANLRRKQTKQSLLLSSMLQERKQLRAGDELVSPHGGMALEKKAAEEPPPTLQEEIAKDPYVSEGVTLLRELLESPS